MLQNQNTYIYSIEGKDLYGKILEIKEGKKFKATLDYSLEAIQIEKLSQAVYKNKRDRENTFYQKDDKQYTNRIINLTFKYNVKEYNLITIKDKEYYVHINSGIDNKSFKDNENPIIFDNGLYIKNDMIQAIEINSETNIEKKKLPRGFGVKNGKIYLTSTGIKTIANSDDVRNNLYINGFKIKYSDREIIEYIRFKRSSGSSRVGKCLFIDKRLYRDMVQWSLMGLNFEDSDEIDLAGLEAYISLTVSSIIDTINIEAKNILLIDDYESIFEDIAMVTEVIKEEYIDKNGIKQIRDRLNTSPKKTKIINSIWDGQSLGDESLFKEKYEDKGFILLRNQFLKTACFNTKIQKFFKDNDITSISQLNGFTLAEKIEEILLIITPSSIKYLKFGKKEKYFEMLSSIFGVVKYDKPTHYFDGRMVQTHYQLLNTLQLNELETKDFLQNSLDYIKLLKTDIRVFREHLNIKIKENIEYGDINSTDEFMMTMLKLNNKFENTDLFNTFRQDTVKSYIKNIKRGHVLINGNYSVLCGNGIEMLKSSCKSKEEFDGNSILDKDEIYCKNFNYNKQLIASRSPHVTIGNIWLPINANKTKADKMLEYFNSSKQIVHINSIKTNVLERLSSADFDSDAILLSDSELLISKAKINYDKFLVPTSIVEAKKVPRFNTSEQKCDLDIKTSKNLIGEIINCSQILNSKLWDSLNTKQYKITDIYIQNLYAIISQLDVMSCIEIDKAKKEFSIDNQLELDEIRKKYIKGTKKPVFFSFLSKYKGNDININNYKKHKTTMDYLIHIINKETRNIRQKPRIGDNKPTTFGELFSKENKIELKKAKNETCKSIINKASENRIKIANIWNNKDLSSEDKFKQTGDIKNDFIKFVSSKQMSSSTIKKIIYDLDKESIKLKDGVEIKTEISKNARVLLSILYKTHRDNFISIFEDLKEPMEYIKMCGTIKECKIYMTIYGIKYEIKSNIL